MGPSALKRLWPLCCGQHNIFINFLGELRSLTLYDKLKVGNFIPFHKDVTKNSIEWNWNNWVKKILKFQRRFKIHNTQQKALHLKLFWSKSTILISKSVKYRICKNLWPRFSKLKLAYHLSSWMTFSNL